ncbi:Beta-glucuronosyltransferase GlcAT14A [Gracilariopsis chorda]|uniref:protein xylosyltransferase n=1 Tax=Gracilariopsis chorda TaxID=448386 RepID=A0A2V3IQ85_9FLOR|nr:Beta-glucuronosyltransferase GlcAT14A [Gracilariopsis chorda]|eukprot:PXF44223.1 Beta-glucuronosyltransferase GlcAT14A [Gracilariopsis chorda]
MIQLSPANYHLLPRLLRALYDQDNYYALHFDPKIAATDAKHVLSKARDMLDNSGIKQNDRNVLVLEPEVITYRGMTMTLNFLTGAERLLSTGDWDFFINLSGADFPTASQRLMKELLGRVSHANFVEWKPHRTWPSYAKRRLGHFYVDTGLVTMRSSNGSYLTAFGRQEVDSRNEDDHIRNPIAEHVDFTLAKSSGWVVLSRRFTRYVLRDSRARRLLVALGYTDASDEHYFASLLWNSAFRETVVDSNLRNIFFVAPNGSFAMGSDGKRRRQHPFWVDELDEASGELMFWRRLWDEPGLWTRKIRGVNGLCERVEREMIGIGHDVDRVKVREYESRMEKRFGALVTEVTRVANVDENRN